ncbi:hypothetical protein, partial [Klebsiella pneumoniae]|uniref:hypothetical protein n=1 Tax=Klebsiella pneumoniae TaxID=573 RepID=UPI00272FE199
PVRGGREGHLALHTAGRVAQREQRRAVLRDRLQPQPRRAQRQLVAQRNRRRRETTALVGLQRRDAAAQQPAAIDMRHLED